MKGVQARIRTVDNQLIAFGEGDVDGELEIKSESMFKEYWKLPDKTASEFTEDGWFKTGDTARFDSGHSYI